MAKNLTEVRLLTVPFENDYLHTLYFPNRATQESYFKEKTEHIMTNCVYQRQDNYIRFDKPFDDIINCNYVMYKNPAFSNRWYYAFITKMEYKDDSVTLIYIETDVIQTWWLDCIVKSSFVEREHVINDNIGSNTIPEQVELGEYVVQNSVKCVDFAKSGIVLACTVDLRYMSYTSGSKCPAISGTLYGGVFSGVYYYYFPMSFNEDTSRYGYEELSHTLNCLASMGQSDAVVSIFIVPEMLIEYETVADVTVAGGDLPIRLRRIKQGLTCVSKTWDNVNSLGVYKPEQLKYYIPKNKKLLTFPYCYINMSNNAGSSAIYKYEYFENGSELCTFQVNGVVTPGFSARLVPLHYKGSDINHEEGLNAGKMPICGWNTDVYTNWLTQNSVNIGVSVGTSLLSIAGGIGLIASGGGSVLGVGAIASGVTGIANSVGEVYQHSLCPPQAEGNVNNGDVVFAQGELGFTAYQMSIKPEYARVIDNYFTMFGYKVNRVHPPYYAHREAFWYTKTIDVNIDGAIPMNDMRKLKDCYNRGITFWRHTVDIGNYNQDNNIVLG